jgi:hypothetical protein
MSYICDVCGPRTDSGSIFCEKCEIGIIYEINTKNVKMLRQISSIRTQKSSIPHRISRLQSVKSLGLASA